MERARLRASYSSRRYGDAHVTASLAKWPRYPGSEDIFGSPTSEIVPVAEIS